MRVLTYNILVGGTSRINQLFKMIASVQPDIVGVIEATNLQVIEQLAERLNMSYYLSGYALKETDWHLGILSHLPVRHVQTHIRPDVFTKQYVLEACVEEPDGSQIAVFVTHLTADFYKGGASNRIRQREIRELVNMLNAKQGIPRLLMGDFNSIAPEEQLQGSAVLRYILELTQHYQQHPEEAVEHPDLDFVVPPRLRFLSPLLQTISKNRLLSGLLDAASPLYAPRGIGFMYKAGYVDSFRHLNPSTKGFTYPASNPAGRIDFIFCSPELAQRLSRCYVVQEGNGIQGKHASDHLPVLAEFSSR